MADIGKIFTAAPRSLADFLSINDQGCFIPSYQRAYSWGRPDVKRLFEDTVDGLRRLIDSPASLRFLGTIIAVDDKNVVPVDKPMDVDLPNAVLTIIDGQQRLCTLVAVNIVLHDFISRLRAAIAPSPASDGFLQVVDDYLFDLAKTIRFEGKPSTTLWKNYPRVIRAYDDQWARSQQNARYESPIARLIWAYVQHMEAQGAGPAFAVTGGFEEAGHAALADVVEYARSAAEEIAQGKVETIPLPPIGDLVSEAVQNAAFWADKFASGALDFIDDDPAAEPIVRLMAFGRYLNTRMAITVVTTSAEDYAFDMFEALNTTGQPLTAYETFRPKVVEFETQAAFYGSPSQDHLREVELYLGKFDKAQDRQRATTSMLIPFALLHTGERLESHLSAQRRYLRSAYEALPATAEKREFTSWIGTTAKFLRTSWDHPGKVPAFVLPSDVQSADPVAGFCFEALRSIRHDVAIAPLVRFYAEAARLKTEQSVKNYEGAVKAMAAFSMMWRAARGGTSNVDAQYRALMAGGTGVPRALRLRNPDLSVNAPPTLAELQQSLWKLLGQRRVNIDSKEAWVVATAQRATYLENSKVARFLLMAAFHNSVSDGAAPGQITSGGRRNLDMLTPQQWYDEKHMTLEHVAPQGSGLVKWAGQLTEDSRTVHQLGNLLLLPYGENDALADEDWDHKRSLLKVFAAESNADADAAVAAAEAKGIVITQRLRQVIDKGDQLPLARPLADFAGPWDAQFVAVRSRRLAELAWDTMVPWLGTKPN